MTRKEELRLMEMALRIQIRDAKEFGREGLDERQLASLQDAITTMKCKLFGVQQEIRAHNTHYGSFCRLGGRSNGK